MSSCRCVLPGIGMHQKLSTIRSDEGNAQVCDHDHPEQFGSWRSSCRLCCGPFMQAYPDVPLIEATVSLAGSKPAVTSWTAVSIPFKWLSVLYPR